jgi:hypothetical protein
MKALSILGSGSGAGKSWVTTALGAWLHGQGIRVAPFKAQNMSNNAWVTGRSRNRTRPGRASGSMRSHPDGGDESHITQAEQGSRTASAGVARLAKSLPRGTSSDSMASLRMGTH